MQKILILCIFVTPNFFAMVQPPRSLKYSQTQKASWHSLPADVKKLILPLIASSNVYEVAETMKALNATDRSCHALMQSESIVMSILKRMPYLVNHLCLLERLNNWPVRPGLQGRKIALWAHLRNGGELLNATKLNKIERIKELLTQENLQLNCHTGNSSETSLALALYNGYREIAVALIKAGAIFEWNTLVWAVKRDDAPLVQLLLEYGADPNKLNPKNYHLVISIPEIRQLIHGAQEKRKKRMRLLCGKKS